MKSCLSYATIAVVLLVVGFQRTHATCLDECFDKWRFCRISCISDPCASNCEVNYGNCKSVCTPILNLKRRLNLNTKLRPSLEKTAKVRHVWWVRNDDVKNGTLKSNISYTTNNNNNDSNNNTEKWIKRGFIYVKITELLFVCTSTKFGKTDDGKRTYWLREITRGLLPAGFLPDFRTAISVCHPSLEMNKGSSKDPWWTECITQWKIWRALCGDSRLKFANVAKSDTLLLKCSWHENVYFIFLLATYVYYNLKIVETTLSSFAFFLLQIHVSAQNKVPLEAEIGMFWVRENTQSFKRNFQVWIRLLHLPGRQATKQKFSCHIHFNIQ